MEAYQNKMVEKNWKDEYEEKLCSPDEAVKLIISGDKVVFESSVNEPEALVNALVARAEDLRGVEIIHMTTLGKGRYTFPDMAESFHHTGLYVSGPVRKAVQEGRADFVPCYYSEVPEMYRSGVLKADAVLITVTPPDEEGYCSFGLTVDYIEAVIEVADVVLAQINPLMPRTGGEKIHISRFTKIVEKEEPLLELQPPKVGEVETAIAAYVADLIPDGATLQLGIGAIPDTVLRFLKDKKDLGIHSEMFSDGVVDLARAGVITNQKKGNHKGKFVATFLMGTKKLYDFVDGNPDVEMLPVDYVNDPYIIGQNDNLISINSALQVDLTGQVNAETMGSKHYTGIGGQVDFVRGAKRSKGGKSIIALPSTAKKGSISRIVNDLGAGSAVTTSRADVEYIITEYGVADLRGLSLRERAHALVAIAHPDFRDQLLREAREIGRYL